MRVGPSITASLSRRPDTNVPLVDPASSTTKPDSSASKRAWRLLILGSGTVSVATPPLAFHARVAPRPTWTSRTPRSGTRMPPESGRSPSRTT